jgi:hypothetical protein
VVDTDCCQLSGRWYWQLQHEGGQVEITACTISLETSKIFAVYDFDGDEMYLAIGKININGKFNYSGNDGLWCAYEPRTGNM